MDDLGDQPVSSDIIPEEVTDILVENWCWTNVSLDKFNFLWTISNFSYCNQKTGEHIKSPLFSSKCNDTEKWCLRLNPRGQDEESKNYISIYLFLATSKKLEVMARFKFSIVNGFGKVVKETESQRAYRFVYGKDWGFKKFIKRDTFFDKENQVLKDDKLTIFCEVSIVTAPVSVFGKHEEIKFKVPEPKLEDDYEQLLSDHRFSDVTLSANGKQFKAHKAILAARSRVFAAMFDHCMEEGQLNHVTILDVDHATLGELLRFIYSGRVKDINKIAFDLLAAADKYDLERLKIMCEETLYKSISVDNVLDILILADLHSAVNLKSQAIELVCEHAKDIINTEGWNFMVKSHPHLVAEAFAFLSGKEVFFSPPLSKRIKHE
ncbi:speckle-type POZ protein B-like [Macrosteles quadrilineatus]|uniref:speckle-type POZ protein B-like n=1 Tax=Macrosteles quadrilineatus TaxID=74068 RepID=UPI0023E1A479|nr:speckle-type POZ protein B-like [Macrosteles quadrilineatus]XP_054272489.1 speckle-type POZ protein B-like [Macrosteles quadrilineatus]